MTSRRNWHAPCQRDFLTSYSSATRHEWLNLFSSRHECFTSDSGLTRTRLVSCVFLTSLITQNQQIARTSPLRSFICVKHSLRHSVDRLRIFLSPHLKRKKVKTATKDLPQSERERSTPRSRILSLSTWAVCDSTKAGGRKTLKYGRAHSAKNLMYSRPAVVRWRTWWSCSSLNVVYPLFSLKGRDNSLV